MFENLRFRAGLRAVAVCICRCSAQSRRRYACEDSAEARPLLRLNGFKHALGPQKLTAKRCAYPHQYDACDKEHGYLISFTGKPQEIHKKSDDGHLPCGITQREGYHADERHPPGCEKDADECDKGHDYSYPSS